MSSQLWSWEVNQFLGYVMGESGESKARGKIGIMKCFQGRLPCWLRWYRICLHCRRPGFNPWVRKIPWGREWLPAPVFLPGDFHGQRSLEGYSPCGHKRVGQDWATITFIFPMVMVNCPSRCISLSLSFFCCGACGILVPWPSNKPVPLALESQSLTMDNQGSP